MNFYRFFKSL